MKRMVFDNKYYFEEIVDGIGRNGYILTPNIIIVNGFSYYGYEDNIFIIESSFRIFDNNGDEINLGNSNYSKIIWEILFELKKIHYDKYKPSIVRIDFKNNIPDINKRISNYEKYINFGDVEFLKHPFLNNIGYYGKSNILKSFIDNKFLVENNIKIL